jgi:hypothetical protein
MLAEMAPTACSGAARWPIVIEETNCGRGGLRIPQGAPPAGNAIGRSLAPIERKLKEIYAKHRSLFAM